jgi:hypothetical protein
MRKKFTGPLFLYLCCLLALGLASSSAALAQSASAEKPPVYTYVSEWAVPRAMWADYQKQMSREDEAVKKAMADGTLIAYGSYSVLNHQEGQATHGSWFSANSLANIIKFLEQLRASPDSTSPALAASKHWDYILRSENYNYHSGNFSNGYLRVSNWSYKPGANDPDGKILKSTMVAMLEKLMAEGALHGYQVDEEDVHSADPNAFFVGIIANGAEGLDKFDAAVQGMFKNNPASMAGFGSLIDFHGHRDMLAKVDTMSHK